MTVIGRLDDQVDDVLIKPLSKGRARERPPEPDAGSSSPATPNDVPGGAADEPQGADGRSELPVWLL